MTARTRYREVARHKHRLIALHYASRARLECAASCRLIRPLCADADCDTLDFDIYRMPMGEVSLLAARAERRAR